MLCVFFWPSRCLVHMSDPREGPRASSRCSIGRRVFYSLRVGGHYQKERPVLVSGPDQPALNRPPQVWDLPCDRLFILSRFLHGALLARSLGPVTYLFEATSGPLQALLEPSCATCCCLLGPSWDFSWAPLCVFKALLGPSCCRSCASFGALFGLTLCTLEGILERSWAPS